MEPIQAQMVFCCAEQWMGGYFYQVEPWGDGLRLDPERASTGVYCLPAVDSGEKGFFWSRAAVEADLPPDTALRIYARAADSRRWEDWPDLDRGIRSLEGDPLRSCGRSSAPRFPRAGSVCCPVRGDTFGSCWS